MLNCSVPIAVPGQVSVIQEQGKSGRYMQSQQMINKAAYFLMEDHGECQSDCTEIPPAGARKKKKV